MTKIISNQILSFLSDLKINNNREWFQGHKGEFQQISINFENFVQEIIFEISKFDKSIINTQAKDCIFRIYRDVRFSNDKSPYKTNIGAVFAEGGRKSRKACYYLHIEPDSCFLSGGVYMPEPNDLKAIRNEIYYNASSLKSILEQKDFVKIFPDGFIGEKLMKIPKDFPKDFEYGEWLKFKNYYVMHYIHNQEIYSNQYFNKVLSVFKLLKPLNDFLNHALEM